MKKIKLTGVLFEKLLTRIEERCREILEEQNEFYELPDSKGPAFFGFKPYDNFEDSVKGIMTRDQRVIDYLLNLSELNKEKKITEADIPDLINGKFLYNKYLEYQKNRNKPILFTGIYSKVFFIFLGCQDFEGFMRSTEVDEGVKDIQRAIQDASTFFISNLAEKFVGRYFSFHDNEIKRFILELDYLNDMRVRQTGFHYVSKANKDLQRKEALIGPNKIYEGQALDQGSIVFLNLKSVSKEQGEHNYMSIFLYVGGMNLENMDIVRGVLTTQSIHGYIFSGEVFLRKVPRETANISIIENGHRERDTVTRAIKRYLMLQRRTIKVSRRTPQKMEDLTAKKYRLDVLEDMEGVWKIWGLDHHGRIMQSCLIIESDYTARLRTNSRERNEEQVCIFRIAKGNQGNHLWISAHQEEGIELQNVAVVEIPNSLKERTDITSGSACGLGVVNNTYALTPIVLLKVDNDEFPIRKLTEQEIMSLLFTEDLGVDTASHTLMYQRLEELHREYFPAGQVNAGKNLSQFLPISELSRRRYGEWGSQPK